jgi:hypothetical protein
MAATEKLGWRLPAMPPATPLPPQDENLMKSQSRLFHLQLPFTLAVRAFLMVPVVLSILEGLTVNYLVGLESGMNSYAAIRRSQ